MRLDGYYNAAVRGKGPKSDNAKGRRAVDKNLVVGLLKLPYVLFQYHFPAWYAGKLNIRAA